MNNIRRNHPTIIIDGIITTTFRSLIPLLLLLFGKLGSKGFLNQPGIRISIVMCIVLLIMIYEAAKWYKKVFSIGNSAIFVKEGVFFVKQREVPFSKIQTINLSQNIKNRIFKTSTLKVDTGNASIGSAAEVILVLRIKDAEILKESIVSPSDTAANIRHLQESPLPIPASLYKVTKKDLVLIGLTSNGIFAGIAFLGSLYALLDDLFESLFSKIIDSLSSFVSFISWESMPLSSILFLSVMLFILYLLFSLSLSLIGGFIKYYGFTAKREGDTLIINYGLLENKKYILQIKKIKAVYIKQNPLRQLFGLKAFYVESVGYGNEKGESSLLYPILHNSKEKEILSSLLPEFSYKENEVIRVPKRSLPRFITSSSLLPLILIIFVSLILDYGFLGFFILPFFVLMGCLEYRNSAICWNSTLLCIKHKGFFKTTSLIMVNGVQSVSESSNYFHRKKNLFNYSVSIQSNIFGKMIKIKNLDNGLKQELLEIV
ncbi:MAG: PH domain-containing protein [Clostridia bacterium]|nr:PH domain-containing protein [Clostridia bacterium]